ncbi:hypothetical protein L3X38_024781 [Prunus dulcis]|uniref:Uncharacterized protein n=1 Tax=Prunus dulcis TaxID=3755 RepID=A0AAD4W1J6_PRUDU|nr:hypothetical protein L3X38_024781 [Prunus dulcis]
MASSSTTITHQTNGTWLLDTRENAYVTLSLQNIVNPKEYHGDDNVGGVGNDSGLPISHFGSNTIQSNSCLFHLNDILHCPYVCTSLVLVHRFTSDNNCYILIFPDSFIVKDLKTQKTFFQGMCENGLYPFQLGGGLSNQQFLAFAGTQELTSNFPVGRPSWDCSSPNSLNFEVPMTPKPVNSQKTSC